MFRPTFLGESMARTVSGHRVPPARRSELLTQAETRHGRHLTTPRRRPATPWPWRRPQVPDLFLQEAAGVGQVRPNGEGRNGKDQENIQISLGRLRRLSSVSLTASSASSFVSGLSP